MSGMGSDAKTLDGSYAKIGEGSDAKSGKGVMTTLGNDKVVFVSNHLSAEY